MKTKDPPISATSPGNLKAIYRGTISVVIANGTVYGTNTATITSVDTTKSLITYLGVISSQQAAFFTAEGRIELTNATTITAYVALSHSAGAEYTGLVGYQVVEYY